MRRRVLRTWCAAPICWIQRARQIYLQRLLGLPTPHYLHVPLVSSPDGGKLSKQTGARAIDLAQPQRALLEAAEFLGLRLGTVRTLEDFWRQAPGAWAQRLAERMPNQADGRRACTPT